MATDNSVVLVGNITRDPELRFTNTGPADGLLRAGRQPALAEPPDPGVGGSHLLLRRGVLARNGRERERDPDAGAPGSWWPADSSSAAGRPRRATSAPRSKWWPTRSDPPCAGPPPRSPRTSDGARVTGRPAAGQPPPAIATPTSSPQQRWRLRIRRGAFLMARNNQRGGTTTRRAPKDLGRRVKKKPCALCRDQHGVGRLQGRPHAAQVHERPREDPLAPGHRELRPAPAGTGPGHQDGP